MQISTTVNVGLLSGKTINDFYEVCRRNKVMVVSCNKIGGILVLKYHVTVEGDPFDIQRASAMFNN